MSVKLNQLVDSLVKTAPPGELNSINSNLDVLTSNTSIVDDSIETYINENSAVFSSRYIASKYNKDSNSSKYIDYVNKKMFNIDIKTLTAIDIEQYFGSIEYPGIYHGLVDKLEIYGQDHYPKFAFTVIPQGGQLRVIIIGQRLNPDNFYTGQWKSEYVIENGQIQGDIDLDIHYYEDGNVRLKLQEKVHQSAVSNASDVVNFINNSETKVTLDVIEQFNQLNQTSFKNLRRLLPVTRSKINWGNAIGNYRLGSDVVNKN
ncbi:F-actin-capping protein subunit alpha [Spathaspora sp. JA1]|nr:F-actin-capping protein subunit alpha [Spathaspora sp. JA1]